MKSVSWPSPFGYTIFCDDVRYETNGKVTLVGVFSEDMRIAAQFPIALPKFVISFMYMERPGESDDPLELRVYLPGDPDDQPSIKAPLAEDDTKRLRSHQLRDPSPEVDGRVAFRNNVELSPLFLIQPGKIKVRMLRGDEEIKLGTLTVVQTTPQVAS